MKEIMEVAASVVGNSHAIPGMYGLPREIVYVFDQSGNK